MRISLDTQKDSPESIRKVINLLHELVNDPLANYSPPSGSVTLSNASTPDAPSQGILNLFGPVKDAQSSSPSQDPTPTIFDVFKSDESQSASKQLWDDEFDEDDKEDDKKRPDAPKPPIKMRESDPRAKRFDFPDDQISIIEY